MLHSPVSLQGQLFFFRGGCWRRLILGQRESTTGNKKVSRSLILDSQYYVLIFIRFFIDRNGKCALEVNDDINWYAFPNHFQNSHI
jgi:hypothetical protein